MKEADIILGCEIRYRRLSAINDKSMIKNKYKKEQENE